jgi:hypothetical protein
MVLDPKFLDHLKQEYRFVYEHLVSLLNVEMYMLFFHNQIMYHRSIQSVTLNVHYRDEI